MKALILTALLASGCLLGAQAQSTKPTTSKKAESEKQRQYYLEVRESSTSQQRAQQEQARVAGEKANREYEARKANTQRQYEQAAKETAQTQDRIREQSKNPVRTPRPSRGSAQ